MLTSFRAARIVRVSFLQSFSSPSFSLLCKSPISFKTRMMSASNSRSSLVAVCQMTSKEDKDANFNQAREMIEKASGQGCKMIL